MKSRATVWLLLVAAAAIWGIVVWKILTPKDDTPVAVPLHAVSAAPVAVADTLLLDYPDPFLKGIAHSPVASRPVVRSLPAPKTKPPQREFIQAIHLGTVSYSGKTLYILTIGGEQYELAKGDTASDFVLTGCDGDSLYLRKDGLTYGVKLCD